MDDRTWTDKDPERMIELIRQWFWWSGKMGLKENKDKVQIATAGTQTSIERMSEASNSWYTEEEREYRECERAEVSELQTR